MTKRKKECFETFQQLFQLFVLLTLLDSEGLTHVGPFKEILQLRQKYLKLFQRKLNALGCSYIDYACFRRTLNKVRVYATLVKIFKKLFSLRQ